MNVVINGFHHLSHAPLVRAIVEAARAERCIHIYDDHRFEMPAGVHATCLHWQSLPWRADYGVDEGALAPLDEELIARMYPAEAVFLKMADRLEDRGRLTYGARKSLYLKHLRYWNDALTRERIGLLVSSNVPHETFDYVLYALCKERGIPTLILYQCQIYDTIFVMQDVEEPAPDLRRRLEALGRELAGVPEENIALARRFEDDRQRHTHPSANPTPFYMAPEAPPAGVLGRWRHSLARLTREPHLLGQAFDPATWSMRFAEDRKLYQRQRAERELRERYAALASAPDLDRRYIYFPLHYQPEVSTSPMGGAFVDQLLVAQLIAAYLPADVALYVKEHPKQTCFGRDESFYEELARIPGVRLVPTDFSTYSLLERSLAVATVTGTAGWEALYDGKPVLLFGHNFYQYAPGVFPIHSSSDCAHALATILAGEGRPTPREMRLFLKALEETTIEGYVDPVYAKVSRLSPSESIANVSRGLTAAVEAIRRA